MSLISALRLSSSLFWSFTLALSFSTTFFSASVGFSSFFSMEESLEWRKAFSAVHKGKGVDTVHQGKSGIIVVIVDFDKILTSYSIIITTYSSVSLALSFSPAAW